YALTLLATPPVQFVAVGVVTSGSDTGKPVLWRMRGGVDHRHAVLCRQEFDPDNPGGGGVQLALGYRPRLGAMLHAALGKPSPGQYQPPTVYRRDLDPDQFYGNVFGSDAESAYDEAMRFFRRPTANSGEISVAPDLGMDTRAIKHGRVIKWANYVDDGCYLVNDSGDPITAVAATVETIGQQLMVLVEEAEEINAETAASARY
ncbi:MAG: hypothetical protein GX542_05600, partial [Rhodococcus sp.]|nr:hypothetical protein [Rhodococcus sp. (in: high G+C Gram-positive bacteria)]